MAGDTTIEVIRATIANAVRMGWDWRGADPEKTYLRLAIELDELHEAIDTNRRSYFCRDSERVKDELGDVLFMLVRLADACGVDLAEAGTITSRKVSSRL